MNKNIVIGGSVVVVLILAFFFATAGDNAVDPATAFGAVTIEGAPLPKLEDPSIDAAVGGPAPVVTGVDLNGDEMTIGVVDQPTILLFLAHWCSHCQSRGHPPVAVARRQRTRGCRPGFDRHEFVGRGPELPANGVARPRGLECAHPSR